MADWRDFRDGVIYATIAYPRTPRRWFNASRVRRVAGRHFSSLGAERPGIRLYHTREMACPRDGLITRRAGGFDIGMSERESPTNWIPIADLGTAYLYWLSRCPPEVDRITVTLADGDLPTEARFAPSTNRPDVIPLPDPYYFEQRGFIRWQQLAERSTTTWAERSDDIVWRGATTGAGSADPQLAESQPQYMTDRLRLCLALRGVPGTDVQFSASATLGLSKFYLARHGIAAAAIPEESWVTRKFAFDVDGNSNTWSNLIIRLHLGCCVLKVAGSRGYRQWYYDRLKPWEHYVPVSADLSDLSERIEWVRANDREASQIAQRGQALARTLGWDAVVAEAVGLITANWRGPQAA